VRKGSRVIVPIEGRPRDGIVMRVVPTRLGREAEVQLDDGATVWQFDYVLQLRPWKPTVAVLGVVFAGVIAAAAVFASIDSHVGGGQGIVRNPLSRHTGPGVTPSANLRPIGGYSPANRPTFTWDKPATYVVFNSITDDAAYGDERAFFDGTPDGSHTRAQDVIEVHDQETIVLRVFYLNDAASNLNLNAVGVRVRILLPSGPKKRTAAAAMIEASNGRPRVVSDTVTFVGQRYFTVEYVPGSAQIWTNAMYPGRLSDSVTTSGALLGYDKLDGVVSSDPDRCSGWVTIKVKIYMADA
jgi:hypothetical protein